MPSPFPGMNPYLEQDDAWEDFHWSFLPAVRAVLAAQVGSNYIVKIEKRLYIHPLAQDESHHNKRKPAMPSPFPGMNPYLEQDDAWEDFHQRFATVAAEVLGSQTGPEYFVKIEERLYIHDMPDEPRRFLGRADVFVADARPQAEAESEVAVLEAPVRVLLPAADVERSACLEIRDRRNRRLITVIELLSPSNKRAGDDRERYLTKREELLYSRAHFVEIDLLRGHERMPMRELPECAYCVLVSRVDERPHADLWPISLRERLPLIPVPLQAPDKDLQLDLQAVLHRVYDAASYQRYIYDGAPEPPLSPEDEVWARQLLGGSV